MKIEIGSLVVVPTVRIDHVVANRVFKVVSIQAKQLKVSVVDQDGNITDPSDIRAYYKKSIIAVLNSMDDFKIFQKINEETSEAYAKYLEVHKKNGLKVQQMKSKLHE